MTELANMACLSQSDLVFKWGWALLMATREKRIDGSKDSSYQALRRGSQVVALDEREKASSTPLNHVPCISELPGEP